MRASCARPRRREWPRRGPDAACAPIRCRLARCSAGRCARWTSSMRRQASRASGCGTKTARDRIQERVDDLNVRMRSGELRFDPIDQLEHVVLITAREGERTDRVVHGSQSLVYFCQLLGIHGDYSGPRSNCASAQLRSAAAAAATQRRARVCEERMVRIGVGLFDRRLVGIFRHGRGVARRPAARADVRQQHLRVGRDHHGVHAGAVARLSRRRPLFDAHAERATARRDPDRRRADRRCRCCCSPSRCWMPLSLAVPDPRFGSLLGADALFFVPTFFSGMVSPYAVRLLVRGSRQLRASRRAAVLRLDLRQRRRHVADVVLSGAVAGSESDPARAAG